jgi:hypothetical protein
MWRGRTPPSPTSPTGLSSLLSAALLCTTPSRPPLQLPAPQEQHSGQLRTHRCFSVPCWCLQEEANCWVLWSGPSGGSDRGSDGKESESRPQGRTALPTHSGTPLLPAAHFPCSQCSTVTSVAALTGRVSVMFQLSGPQKFLISICIMRHMGPQSQPEIHLHVISILYK